MAIVLLPVSYHLHAQPTTYDTVGTIPTVNVGGTYMTSQFARLGFAQMMLEAQKRQAENAAEQRKLIESGTVSALDLQAPGRAVAEFNKAASLLKEQKAKEAVPHLEKAIALYPKFISAHNNLGLAYSDLGATEDAKSEFEIAAKLDDKFPGTFVHLGQLALSEQDFDGAESHLKKAAALRPRDANMLMLLAYAENGAHEYHHAIETSAQVHALPHKGMANVHYIAASAAIALKSFDVVQRELEMFIREDPSNPLAPAARQNLEVLARSKNAPTQTIASLHPAKTVSAPTVPQTFPNSERLQAQLAALGDDTTGDLCSDCATAAEPSTADVPSPAKAAAQGHTFRSVVEEVAVFFAVTDHGHVVSGLKQEDIRLRDDNKTPERVVQFAPQSKLPLHLGLLVDTSGSVQPRFAFEKRAAIKFVQEMLGAPSDLAFVARFSNAPSVTQDFTGEHEKLAKGVQQLTNSGGTSLFDAVSFACWKLAAYPEQERIARVLVVLTDGEDNSSHTSLKQAIQDAETTGVTVYTISTRENRRDKADADKVLEALAERSGGEALFPGDMMMLGKSLDKLRDLIRSRYLIAYKPAEFAADGRYRQISIIATKDGKRLQVHARKGYHARREASTSQ